MDTFFGSFTDAEPGSPPPGMYVPIHFPSLAVLGTRTRDGRLIHPEGFAPLDLPRSIKLKTRDADGHDGAEVAGRLDEVVVSADGNVSGRGWALNDETGRRAAYLIKTQALRGNSVDLAIAQEDMEVLIRKTDSGDLVMDRNFRNARLKATTLLTEPAFDNAGAIIPDGWTVGGVEEPEALVASATAAASAEEHAFSFSVVKERPKVDASLFADPALTEPTPVFVDEKERVFGHIACWRSEHMSHKGVKPPRSRSGYAYFANKAVLTDDGFVSTGPLILGGDHAPEHLGYLQAIDHYANTHSAWADVAIGEDDFGIWVAGMVRPGTSNATLHTARASGQSGDWRRIGANMELIASQCVNVEGFPKARPAGRTFGHDEDFALTVIGAGALAPRVKAPATTFAVPREITYLANRFATDEARDIALALESEVTLDAAAILAELQADG